MYNLMRKPQAIIIVIAILLLATQNTVLSRAHNMDIDKSSTTNTVETATFGGGCFWCLEPIFSELEGVVNVEVGYAGGHVVDPTYQEVCTGTTGHAEVVHITFRPDQVSFQELLEIFFSIHDPTTMNRQGADVGNWYRSIILHNGKDQKNTAESYIRELETAGVWNDPIVTEVVPLDTFYKAENYHQEYYQNNPNAPYCRLVIMPKLEKFKKKFKDKL